MDTIIFNAVDILYVSIKWAIIIWGACVVIYIILEEMFEPKIRYEDYEPQEPPSWVDYVVKEDGTKLKRVGKREVKDGKESNTKLQFVQVKTKKVSKSKDTGTKNKSGKRVHSRKRV